MRLTVDDVRPGQLWLYRASDTGDHDVFLLIIAWSDDTWLAHRTTVNATAGNGLDGMCRWRPGSYYWSNMTLVSG